MSNMTANLLSLNDFSSCSSLCLYQSSNSFLATSRHSFFFTSDSASAKHHEMLESLAYTSKGCIIMLLKKNQHVQFGIKIITMPRWVSFIAYK